MAGLASADVPASPAATNDVLSFEKDVRPILKAFCLDCHGGAEKLNGGLDLRLRRFIVTGGESGAAIQPGSPATSLLIQRMVDGAMPPGEKKVPAVTMLPSVPVASVPLVPALVDITTPTGNV